MNRTGEQARAHDARPGGPSRPGALSHRSGRPEVSIVASQADELEDRYSAKLSTEPGCPPCDPLLFEPKRVRIGAQTTTAPRPASPSRGADNRRPRRRESPRAVRARGA